MHSNKSSEVTVNETEDENFLKEFIESNITRKLIPKGMSWFGCMGGLSLLAFMIQLGTGIFLMFYFIPSTLEALASIQHVSHSVPYGWLIQRIHSVGPHIMVGMIFSHMLRILFKGIYRHPRELHWVSGACLLILTLLMYYTGSLLSAHTISGRPTFHLSYIYAMHTAGIPLAMALFMGMHFFMVRNTGIHEPL
jgi:quinol-cytochrome oxidoreductase complex cytochrome b subunit